MGDKNSNDEKRLLFLSENLFRNFITFYPPSGEVFNDYWEAVAQIIHRGNFFLSSQVLVQFRDEVINVLNERGRGAIIDREMIKKNVAQIGSKVKDSLKKEYVEKQLQELQQTYNNDLIPVKEKISPEMVKMRTNFLETIAQILAWRMREEGDLILVVDPQLSGMIGGDEFYRRVIDGKGSGEKIDTVPFIEIIKRVKRDDKGQWVIGKK